jgi:hypothetical protein
MKSLQFILISLVAMWFSFGSVVYCAETAGNFPDGFGILKKKMEQGSIPKADFSGLKMSFSDTLPDEINDLRGYLWSGQYVHPHYKGGPLAYLILLSYDKEEGEMFFFNAWESGTRTKPGWNIIRGKVDKQNSNRIELRSDYSDAPFILRIRSKDSMLFLGASGFEADMKKIGIIKVP